MAPVHSSSYLKAGCTTYFIHCLHLTIELTAGIQVIPRLQIDYRCWIINCSITKGGLRVTLFSLLSSYPVERYFSRSVST